MTIGFFEKEQRSETLEAIMTTLNNLYEDVRDDAAWVLEELYPRMNNDQKYEVAKAIIQGSMFDDVPAVRDDASGLFVKLYPQMNEEQKGDMLTQAEEQSDTLFKHLEEAIRKINP